jgi:hypothetical protein
MLLSKIKFVAAVLVATVVAGAGVAWVSYRAEAGELPAAGARAPGEPPGPQDVGRRAADERVTADRRRQGQQQRLDRAERLLRDSEAEVAKQEEAWFEELVAARLRIMELREDLRARERALDDGPRATDPLSDVWLRTLVADRDRAGRQLAEAKSVAAKEDDPVVKRLSRAVEGLEQKVLSRQRELEKEAADRKARRDDGFAKLRGLRRDLLVAEEKLRALQRRQERQREEARRDLEERARQVRRMRQVVDDPESAGRAPRDLEGKLDEVLRELSELRRSLWPPNGDRPEEP